VNGQDPRNNNYMLDGGNNNDDVIGQRAGTQARTPIEAIQEFQVITNQFDAEYGRASGAVINAVTKSGTNQMRGSVFGYFTGKAVTARDVVVVGVAGLIQSGGFNSFSKNYGLAAAGLLEAEVVTADGAVKVANACTNPDLFWALKGGGGGSFGVVTRLTLRTRELPEYFGAVFGTIKAKSDTAFSDLIARFIGFYHERLFDPHWGEQARFEPGNILSLAMVFQGLSQEQAEALWQPFLDWVANRPQDFAFEQPLQIAALPARHFWNAAFLEQNAPGLVIADGRPGAPEGDFFYSSNRGEAGQFLHGYRSAWLPASLLEKDQQSALADALFAGSRHWSISLHFNKGLAGARADVLAAAKDTAMNPVVLDGFALAIVVPFAAGGPGEMVALTNPVFLGAALSGRPPA
jgi:hypothetical protein